MDTLRTNQVSCIPHYSAVTQTHTHTHLIRKHEHEFAKIEKFILYPIQFNFISSQMNLIYHSFSTLLNACIHFVVVSNEPYMKHQKKHVWGSMRCAKG